MSTVVGTPTSYLPVSLDPKLKRLVASIDSPARIQVDLARSFVTGEPFDAHAPPDPSHLEKLVLVQLNTPRVPDDWRRDHEWIHIVDDIYLVQIPIMKLADLGSAPQVEYVDGGRAMGPLVDRASEVSQISDVHDPAPGEMPFRGEDVIVGIIDFGLDYTHDDFRNADGTTRVAFLWDQGLTPQNAEQAPVGFSGGVEYTEDDINHALGQAEPFDHVRHKPPAEAHGTHVAGIAAGNGRASDADFDPDQYVGAAPEATIVFVQPKASDQNTTFTDSNNVAQAIAYVFAKSKELGLPCVINMSLGQNGGSHDGESIVERAIDRLLETPGRAFVVAAGNEHTWRTHASGTVGEGETRDLQWRVGQRVPLNPLPAGFGDFTPNELEIWHSPRDHVFVSVTSPSGETVGPVKTGETELKTLATGNEVFVSSVRFSPLNGRSQIYIEVSPAPGPGTHVEQGDWTIELFGKQIRDGEFDAWIERDARRTRNFFLDQSFFPGSHFVPIKTLGTPATSRRSVAVANYDDETDAPNGSSGRGPTADGRRKPEVAAPGTNIVSANALGGKPNPNGGVHPMRVSMTGTSMAAPLVAGTVALLLEKNNRLRVEQIRAILRSSTRRLADDFVFNRATGYGAIDAVSAIEMVDDTL